MIVMDVIIKGLNHKRCLSLYSCLIKLRKEKTELINFSVYKGEMVIKIKFGVDRPSFSKVILNTKFPERVKKNLSFIPIKHHKLKKYINKGGGLNWLN